MLITGIKSRPVYDVLQPSESGLVHIIAAQGSGGAPAIRLLESMTTPQREATVVLYSAESLSNTDESHRFSAFSTQATHLFPTNAELLIALEGVLTSAMMGTRLYLTGSEGFIGTAMQIANHFGLEKEEVLREHAGSYARRVWCAHCKAYTENVTKRVFVCPACQLTLVVRDHYSSRLAAFQGVKADGEVPGEYPEVEDLDT